MHIKFYDIFNIFQQNIADWKTSWQPSAKDGHTCASGSKFVECCFKTWPKNGMLLKKGGAKWKVGSTPKTVPFMSSKHVLALTLLTGPSFFFRLVLFLNSCEYLDFFVTIFKLKVLFCLQELEKNMEREKVRLTSIRSSAEAIVMKLGGSSETPNNNSRVAAPTAGIGILGQLNQLEKRWEDFMERIGTIKMEVCLFLYS